MALERPSCAIRFALGVNVQDDARDLAPVGALGVSVQQAQISDDVFLIVNGQFRVGGGCVGNVRIKRRLLQGCSLNGHRAPQIPVDIAGLGLRSRSHRASGRGTRRPSHVISSVAAIASERPACPSGSRRFLKVALDQRLEAREIVFVRFIDLFDAPKLGIDSGQKADAGQEAMRAPDLAFRNSDSLLNLLMRSHRERKAVVAYRCQIEIKFQRVQIALPAQA